MAKIYLSAAAHATDNKTQCPIPCGENIHCNQYMDIVERRLKELGVETKRGDRSQTGGKQLTTRVREANAWGADLYYVAHTNAGGGRYSMTMCWPDAPSKAAANVIHKYRRCLKSHKVKTNAALYEINATAMTCLYDELFFHDNADDCRWFHEGGMALLAEETVQALCEMVGVAYRPDGQPEAVPAPAKPQAGDKVELCQGNLYVASTGRLAVVRTGTFYLYDGRCIHGRYRVTNRPDRVGKQPLAGNVSGWIEL